MLSINIFFFLFIFTGREKSKLKIHFHRFKLDWISTAKFIKIYGNSIEIHHFSWCSIKIHSILINNYVFNRKEKRSPVQKILAKPAKESESVSESEKGNGNAPSGKESGSVNGKETANARGSGKETVNVSGIANVNVKGNENAIGIVNGSESIATARNTKGRRRKLLVILVLRLDHLYLNDSSVSSNLLIDLLFIAFYGTHLPDSLVFTRCDFQYAGCLETFTSWLIYFHLNYALLNIHIDLIATQISLHYSFIFM